MPTKVKRLTIAELNPGYLACAASALLLSYIRQLNNHQPCHAVAAGCATEAFRYHVSSTYRVL